PGPPKGGPKEYLKALPYSAPIWEGRRGFDIIMGQGGRCGRTRTRRSTGKRVVEKRSVAPPRTGRGDGVCASQRAISTTRLRTLPPFHLWPIDVVVSHGPLKKSHLVAGFALICLQRLSLPDKATRHCPWRDNRRTSGPSDPVLHDLWQVPPY